MDLASYVADRIGEIFRDLAEMMSEVEMSEEEAARVPMALFKAELVLKGAWEWYVENFESEIPRFAALTRNDGNAALIRNDGEGKDDLS